MRNQTSGHQKVESIDTKLIRLVGRLDLHRYTGAELPLFGEDAGLAKEKLAFHSQYSELMGNTAPLDDREGCRTSGI
jgi:hypothetical protein